MPNLELANYETQTIADNEMVQSFEERHRDIEVQLKMLKNGVVSNLLYMGELLLEVKDNDHPQLLGFADFKAWLEASDLDIGISQAYYLMRIVGKAKMLGIPKGDLEKVSITGLKEIFSLDPKTDGDTMRELVAEAKNETATRTKEKVDELRLASGEELFVLKAFRVRQSVIEEVIEPALERMRLEYGQNVNHETNEVTEISDGRALEMIFADYLSGAESYAGITLEGESIEVETEQ